MRKIDQIVGTVMTIYGVEVALAVGAALRVANDNWSFDHTERYGTIAKEALKELIDEKVTKNA